MDLSAYSSVDLIIFSKWGTKVYETSNNFVQWDGKWQGKDLPSGTYYYVLSLDSDEPIKGKVVIVR